MPRMCSPTMKLTRRAFVALVGSLPFLKGLGLAADTSSQIANLPTAPHSQRYFASAHVAGPRNSLLSGIRVSLIDVRHEKQWGGMIVSSEGSRGLLRAKFENLKLSILRLAEDETPDFDRVAASHELMGAMLPHFHSFNAE